MRLPLFIRQRLITAVLARMTAPPDFTIGEEPNPYLRRWWIIPRNNWFNIYAHQFLRSDDDRALHDHMYINMSLLLLGSYTELMRGGVKERYTGDVIFRRPSTPHSIQLTRGQAVTLFITGPRVRQWGFHCPKGWRHWTEFVKVTPGGNAIGKGCED